MWNTHCAEEEGWHLLVHHLFLLLPVIMDFPLIYHHRFRLKHRSRVEREEREEGDKKRIKKEVRRPTLQSVFVLSYLLNHSIELPVHVYVHVLAESHS